MKIKLCLISLLVMFSMEGALAAQQSTLKYVAGTIDSMTNNSIVIAGTTYLLDNKVIVHRHIRKNKEIYEVVGKLSDVRPGDKVYARSAGTKVFEIVLER